MFHVPERHRVPTKLVASGNNGAFLVESSEPGWRLYLVCSDSSEPIAKDLGLPRWEHVSVQAIRVVGPGQAGVKSRIPTWKEMCHVKDLCWDAEDVVMQLHPRRSEYVNNHPNVLHLWRPLDAVIPEPPSIYVGIKSA